ncbi:hypothetical protein ANCCAN_09211 [Ancylostoma caninum]|uniref:Uncharacterized protein n=1 Tax=Ancylostoma caninum TaxID=29170 RepID=A0A368GK68_ANCCA|nr:hypothetical protein ANCCAN_09211 [Ancylostoma caninum]
MAGWAEEEGVEVDPRTCAWECSSCHYATHATKYKCVTSSVMPDSTEENDNDEKPASSRDRTPDVRRPESVEIEDLRKQVAELEMYRIRARLHIQHLREKIHSYKSVC